MKFKEVIALEDVAIDLNDGQQFYDHIEIGAGDYFFDSLISDIESLKFSGGIHSKHFGYHRLLSKRFPFAVYYEIEEDFVRVIAVLDMRSNPAWTRKVLRNRKS